MPALEVGLTGGIASGKSLVGERLAELGAVVVDHDVLAREVVAVGTDGLTEVVQLFGDQVLQADGTLDRPKLGSIVFADDQARLRLNAIIHPRVRAAAAQIAALADADAVVVQMIPLLVETGQQDDFDALVVVDVPEEVQLRRLMARNGLDVAEARARLAAQTTRQARLAAADFVIDNSGSIEQTLAQVDALWCELKLIKSRALR